MPIILGRRLPRAVRTKLVSALKDRGRFLTDHGLATESVSSPLYEDHGYWRGPIWAPTTLIALEGLRELGEIEFARDLALRFCRMCAQHGFAENFDARTGEGLCDRPYTWTASVFLVLAHEFLADGEAPEKPVKASEKR
jgi:glycogen debranching enzyme